MTNLKKYLIIGICVLILIMSPEKLAAMLYLGPLYHIYVSDRFLDSIKTLEIPSYSLAEGFPREHIKTFNDFLIFCASVEETRYFSKKPTISITKARLELNTPVQYEDFLAAVSMSISFVGYDGLERLFEKYPRLRNYYCQMFRFRSRNSFFLENVLTPLSHDLKTGEYRGYRFKDEYLQDIVNYYYDQRVLAFLSSNDIGLNRYYDEVYYRYDIKIMVEEIILSNYYAQTFLLIHNESTREAYSELYRYKAPLSILEERHLLPPRPYYFYNDKDRYLWFEFLQSELRSLGLSDFADEILETEIEHYRELINWQLQLRAYLAQKLYEYGDKISLLRLKRLLATEYSNLKSDPLLQPKFDKAIEILSDMDDKVRASSPIDAVKGIIVLPWIDREAIDQKQGIKTEIITANPESITWKTAIENIDDETKEEIKNLYEMSVYYNRGLAVINDRLYLERDLKIMTQLHSNLVDNKNVNCTPTGVSYQDYSGIKSTYGDGTGFPELDTQTMYDLWHDNRDYIPNEFWGLQTWEKNDDKNTTYELTFDIDTNKSFRALKTTHRDEENSLVLDVQTRLNLRLYDLIVSDFWGHQARRKNGDMTVGDIILPWVEVQDINP